jgi:hypothetical protein
MELGDGIFGCGRIVRKCGHFGASLGKPRITLESLVKRVIHTFSIGRKKIVMSSWEGHTVSWQSSRQDGDKQLAKAHRLVAKQQKG